MPFGIKFSDEQTAKQNYVKREQETSKNNKWTFCKRIYIQAKFLDKI